MISGAYSDLKPLVHLGAIARLRAGAQIVPPHMQLIISDLCNHDCSFCAYRMSGYSSNQNFGVKQPDGTVNNNPARMIPTEKCEEILKDAAAMGVKAVEFTGGGEPTVHPDHLAIFGAAQRLGMDTALVTNGGILRSGWQDTLPQMSWIRVSLDAGRADTYAAIRKVPPSTFRDVLENIGKLAAVKDRGRLGVSFVITQENKGEIEKAALVVKETGAPSLRFTAMFSPELAGYYSPEDVEQIERGLVAAESHTSETFKVIDQFSDRLGDLVQQAPDYSRCLYQQFNVYIGADLNVYRCCNTAYNDRGLVGSLKGQRFKTFWESMEKQMAYSAFDARKCEHCAFNNKNRLLNAVTGGIQDENFA